MARQWDHKIFSVQEAGFEKLALEIFHFQYDQNPVYQDYVNALQVEPVSVTKLEQIPFLPISFFKSHAVMTDHFMPEIVFESSGTSRVIHSRHLVRELSIYEESFLKAFEAEYGPVEQYCILALLPSYLERGHSSLVHMVERLMKLSGHPENAFYLYEQEKLTETLRRLEADGQRTILIGVSYALLDFAEKYRVPLKRTIIMETGGMKGKREELIRPELHERLRKAFGVDAIHSEYGMTELLSQAYSKGGGIFHTPPWMKILVREEEDPLQLSREGSGGINVIDLANIWSCAFIASDDAGKIHPDGGFEVLGRIDGSDLRGCSLMLV